MMKPNEIEVGKRYEMRDLGCGVSVPDDVAASHRLRDTMLPCVRRVEAIEGDRVRWSLWHGCYFRGKGQHGECSLATFAARAVGEWTDDDRPVVAAG